MPLGEATRLLRWRRLVEELALLEEAKTPAVLKDANAQLPLNEVVTSAPLEEAEAPTLLVEG